MNDYDGVMTSVLVDQSMARLLRYLVELGKEWTHSGAASSATRLGYQTVSRCLSELRSVGWVTRSGDSIGVDSRRHDYIVTELGREMMTKTLNNFGYIDNDQFNIHATKTLVAYLTQALSSPDWYASGIAHDAGISVATCVGTTGRLLKQGAIHMTRCERKRKYYTFTEYGRTWAESILSRWQNGN